MIEALSRDLSPEQIAIIIAVLVYITKEITAFTKQVILKTKDKTDENTQAVRELTIELKHFGGRLVVIESKLDKAEQIFPIVYKLEKDVGFAHEKIREIKKEM